MWAFQTARATLALAALTAGCSWDWDALEPAADANTDGDADGDSDGDADTSDLSCSELGGRVCSTASLCALSPLPASDTDACCAPTACLSPEERQLTTASRVHEPITVDGDDGDWLEAERRRIVWLGAGTRTSAGDLSARFAAAWDQSALYLLVEVTDDRVLMPDSAEPWHDDAIELFLDMALCSPPVEGRCDQTADYDSDEDQIFVNADGTQTLIHDNLERVTTAVELTGDGWQVEAAVSWPELGGAPAAGRLVGLDVAVDDDDSSVPPGLRSTQLIWSSRLSPPSFDASVLGLLQLIDGDTTLRCPTPRTSLCEGVCVHRCFPGCVDPFCEATETAEASCSNHLDDDCDGLCDCLDPDCHASPGCPPR